MEIYCRTYNMQNQKVLACCDRNVLGKRLKEGKYDVRVEDEFYRGEETPLERLPELMRAADSINLFGNTSVGIALEEGLINESQVISIQGIKHAIIMRL